MSLSGSLTDLADASFYAGWRAYKLDQLTQDPGERFVEIENLATPREQEIAELRRHCLRGNLALYRSRAAAGEGRLALAAFGRALGLERLDANLCAEEDGISAIEVRAGSRGEGDYIPYTPRRLSWHTDGYYNPDERRIRGLLMHCERPAKRGGESLLLDPELVYIWLRDRDPAWIEALTHPRALTIPPNIVDGEVLRPEQSGPVFFADERGGALCMRYSARTRNIEWRDDPATRDAIAFIEALWTDPPEQVLRLRLQAGEGVICNNVLHARTDFEDFEEESRKRLLYRARYLDRISGTEWQETRAAVSGAGAAPSNQANQGISPC